MDGETKIEKLSLEEIADMEAVEKLKAFFKSEANNEEINNLLDTYDSYYSSSEAKQERIAAYKKSKGKNNNVVEAIKLLETVGNPSMDLDDFALINEVANQKFSAEKRAKAQTALSAYVLYLINEKTALTENEIGITAKSAIEDLFKGDQQKFLELKETLVSSTNPVD